MSLSLKNYMMASLAIALSGVVWFFVNDNVPNPPQVVNQTETCGSCTARHSNLTRMRDAGGISAITGE